jgi:HEAT repeat protein
MNRAGASRRLAAIIFLATISCVALTKEEIRSEGAKQNYRALAKWLEDEDSWAREEAARTIGEARWAEGRALLETRLLDSSEKTYVRRAAAEALGALADPASFSVLAGLVERPETPPEVKIALVRAICAYEGPEPIAVIAPLAKNEDLLVAATAQASCRRTP